MKVLLISTSDTQGGAARATLRLHQGLKSINCNSQVLVQTKHVDDKTIFGSRDVSGIGQVVAGSRLTLGQLPLKLFPQCDDSAYSIQWLPDNMSTKVAQLKPDVINLHWICNSYLKIETLAKFNKPIVWTLHDMWPFTGGCHYSGDCDRYTQSCGACPQLGSKREKDLSRWIWKRKAKAWQKLDLTIVTVSSWFKECAISSSLFKDLRIEVIPNGLDTEKYRPIEKPVARKLLGLPQDKKLVLFGALGATSSKRKGFHLLQPALQDLSQGKWQNKLELVVFGASQPENPPEFGFKTNYLGHLNDDLSLALVYSAADVMIVPSLQESFGQTASEALACGTPVVAFNATGLKDIVEHEQNGYLAQPYKIDDLARGIVWVLENEERYHKLAYNARDKVEREFALEIPARCYESLFSEVFTKV